MIPRDFRFARLTVARGRIRYSRGPMLMLTVLEVCLDFACHACCRSVHMIARCEGEVLSLTTKVLARKIIRCPNCGERIDLTFDPEGAVYEVSPCDDTLPQPSLN